jgi:dihydroorotase/N-acyl-D-amino-acid deacylase
MRLPKITEILLGAACSLVIVSGAWSQAASYDIIIRNGHIIDGTGNPWFSGDVAIKDGHIAKIGVLGAATAKRTIDATGLIVTPGYIDLHTHSDTPLIADGNAESKVRQGVTLDVIGEESTVAPRDGMPADTAPDGTKQDWTTFTGYWNKLKEKGISMNVISHVSYYQIRRAVMGYTTKPVGPAELEKMKALLVRSMHEGAWGMVLRFESGGPNFPSDADAIVELAKVVHRLGGNVTSHIGSEGFQQDKEFDFTFRIAREAHVPVHIFHLKIRGQRNWPLMQHYIDRIEQARAEGLDVTANEYPYTAMNHGWSAFFPFWARSGGPADFARQLKDPAIQLKIRDDANFKTWMEEHGGAAGITLAITPVPEQKQYVGMRLAAIAKARGDADPAMTCIQLMAEAGGRIGGIFHTMSEDNVKLVMRQPWIAIASDAGALNVNASDMPHPRTFGTAVRVLGHYVRDEKTLSMEDAVRKMSGFPAQILGLEDRGQIHEGFYADVAVFDPKTVGDTATFEKPKSYPTGVSYVVVNGVLVVDRGQHTGARPGMPVMGKGYSGD